MIIIRDLLLKGQHAGHSHHFGIKRSYLPLCKVSDTFLWYPGDDMLFVAYSTPH